MIHAHSWSRLRGEKAELVAVCSKTRESGEAFARKFQIPHVYTDPRAMMERRDVHVIDLCVTTNLHHRFAIQAAQAVLEDREPVSGIDLACETVEVIYGAYLSAETGKRVDLARSHSA